MNSYGSRSTPCFRREKRIKGGVYVGGEITAATGVLSLYIIQVVLFLYEEIRMHSG